MRLSLARHAPRLTALAPLAALALMTACSGMMQPVQDYDEYIAQQEASKGKWKEAEFTLPAKAPQDADLVSFPTLPSATLDYAIDTKSVQVTDDGVVRYVAVIRSKQGRATSRSKAFIARRSSRVCTQRADRMAHGLRRAAANGVRFVRMVQPPIRASCSATISVGTRPHWVTPRKSCRTCATRSSIRTRTIVKPPTHGR